MTDRVLDASVLAHALIGKSSAAADLRATLRTTVCHAPHLIDAELGNVLRKRVLAGDVTAAHAQTALRAAPDVVDYRYPHVGEVADLAWRLRNNVSFYDALYVALAAQLGVPLLTGDHRLSRAPNLPCSVELI